MHLHLLGNQNKTKNLFQDQFLNLDLHHHEKDKLFFHHIECHNNLILLKDFKSAKPLVDKALSLEKNTDYIWDTKGELEYYLGNYEEAIKAMTNSLNLSKRANSYFYRGLSNIKLGKKTDGCSDLSKAGELGETNAYEEINKNCK